MLSILLKAGAYQAACEESLLEACLSGQVKMAKLLMSWEMTRLEISASALINASSRGLVGIVQLLIKVRTFKNISIFRDHICYCYYICTCIYIYLIL